MKHLMSTYVLMVVSYVLVFFLTPYTLKYLGKEQYGIWVLLSSVISYFNLSNLGLNSTFLVELPKTKGNQTGYNKLINTIFLCMLGLALASTIIVAALYWGFDHLFKINATYLQSAKFALLIVYSTFILSFVASIFDNVLYSTNNIHLKNSYEIGKVILIGVFTFVVLYLGYGLLAVALCHLTVTFFYFFLLFYTAKKVHYFKLDLQAFDLSLLRKIIKPSWHYFVVGLAGQIVFFSDNLLISALKGVEFVALFSIMYRLSDISLKTLFRLSDMKYPKITVLSSQGDYEGLFKLHNRLLGITALAAFALFIVLYFFGLDILYWWLGDKQQFDVRILKVFSIFMLVHSCTHVTALFLTGMGQHGRLSYMAVADSILNLIFSYLFFQYFDLLGIALGTLLSHLCTGFWFVFYEFFRFKRMHRKKQLVTPTLST